MKLKLLLLALLFNFSASVFSQTPVKLSTGQFGFAEGPAWDRNDNIYFSDVSGRIVEKYSVSNNTFTTAFTITSPARTNGLMFNNDLDLVVCDFRDGNVTRRNTSGTILETLATGLVNNSNDLCIDKKGGTYVTAPGNSSNPTNNVYYISPSPSTTTTVIDNTIGFPNGVIISNDGQSLFVSDSDDYDIYKFDIDLNTGLISNKVVYATLADNDNTETRSLADGMALDTNGNLYVTTKKSIQVFNTSGILINTIVFGENPTNCTFGGTGLNTLFVTTPNDLYSVALPTVTGFQHPFDLPDSNLSVNNNNKLSFNVSPNPTSSYNLNIIVGNNEVIKVSLYNEMGQKIEDCRFKKTNNMVTVHFNHNINPGLYILTTTTSKGKVSNNKVVIE
ncbi:SMP-30/gluconolactonase/LRE family protein [uncultured Algibacter sp.]|uniref:SMP-30/gluconolactonase/LRE family protein n=1 Tax=uncultured Algibacter sp. TaxID=298659 RepID=UPI003217DAE0